MGLDPVAGRELSDHRFLELALCGVVDVLDGCLSESKFGFPQVAGQFLVLAIEPFGIDPHREPFVEAKRLNVGVALLFEPRVGQCSEA